ncbi:PqiC family protein [Candidatus Marimicrobium litorale]|jgi:uncharacterized protein|uniref:Membrane integrity-associated transporter subunit PqiC n=1 Tax=Candidatus Marimicrobium litorale TaxID=2518991 RepID=A0ABT3T806_9GAMM|nr:PqiC family protein [Candidatus Marimicrobium litorale]MCX2977624.1 membrane integrity-associated transporter subunit PqiC [Candidatus Marimicrobium litorale]
MKYTYLLLLALLAGCAGQPTEPNSYLLRSSHQLTTRALEPSKEFSMGTVEVASYIDQPGLVLETKNGDMHAARNNLWAEPIYEGVRNLLVTNISQLSNMDLLPHKLTKTPIVLDIYIDQLHGTREGSAKLVALWWLRSGDQLVSAHQFSEEKPLTSAGYPALVQAEEALLEDLARAIANTLVMSKES